MSLGLSGAVAFVVQMVLYVRVRTIAAISLFFVPFAFGILVKDRVAFTSQALALRRRDRCLVSGLMGGEGFGKNVPDLVGKAPIVLNDIVGYMRHDLFSLRGRKRCSHASSCVA
jgi:hypothetical protein